jgi:peptidoglycan L-alanyl-D-glutamate endopeptidase CwlK
VPHFGIVSKTKLNTAHPLLRRVFENVIKIVDCTILEGRRGKAEQNRLYRLGKSEKEFPNSEHNSDPSMAVDVAPYPIDWKNLKRFYFFAGVVIGVAYMLGLKIRWGGDWDGDTDLDDQNFNDLPHFELILKE